MYRVVDTPGGEPGWVLVCDACGQPINDADPGGPVLPRVIRPGKDHVVRHAHAGRCQQVLEEEFARGHAS